MNSTSKHTEQREIRSGHNKNSKAYPMETLNHQPNIIFDENLYTIEWSDIENTEIDYENYLNDIVNFCRKDVENDILEKDNM